MSESTSLVIRTLTPLGGRQESGTRPGDSWPMPRFWLFWVYGSVHANQPVKISLVLLTPSSADDEEQGEIAMVFRL
jgi:hypothetical protein